MTRNPETPCILTSSKGKRVTAEIYARVGSGLTSNPELGQLWMVRGGGGKKKSGLLEWNNGIDGNIVYLKAGLNVVQSLQIVTNEHELT